MTEKIRNIETNKSLSTICEILRTYECRGKTFTKNLSFLNGEKIEIPTIGYLYMTDSRNKLCTDITIHNYTEVKNVKKRNITYMNIFMRYIKSFLDKLEIYGKDVESYFSIINKEYIFHAFTDDGKENEYKFIKIDGDEWLVNLDPSLKEISRYKCPKY